MNPKTQRQIEMHRIQTLKNDYFKKIRSYRQALNQPSIFKDQTLLMLFNQAELAYRLLGHDFGDEGSRGYPE